MATHAHNRVIETELARLVEIRRTHGTISRPDYDESLHRLGKPITDGTRGSLRKRVNRLAPAEPPPSKAFDFADAVLVALATFATLGAFHQEWVLPRYPTLTFASFYRRLHDTVDHQLLSYLRPGRGGMEAFRRSILSCLWHCTTFGQAWQIDVCTLPFKAIPPGSGWKYGVPVKLIAIIDDASRLVVGWDLVYCPPGRSVRARDVCGVLIGAMARYGVPQQVVLDNGREFDNDLVGSLLEHAVVAARFTVRFRGERKGKIERFFGSLVRWMVMCFPSWTAGRSSAARYSVQGGNDRLSPPAKIVEAFLADMIEGYNNKRRHRSLGMTPAEARAADPVELRPLQLHKVLHFAPVHNEGRADEFHDVQGYGINFNNEIFTNLDLTSPGHNGWSGTASLSRMRHARHGVRIRPVPGDPTRIGIYNFHDRFICVATHMDAIATATKLEHSSHNDRLLHIAERLAAAAHTELETRGLNDFGDDLEEDEGAVDVGTLTVCTAVAERLNIRPSAVDRSNVVITVEDEIHNAYGVTVDSADAHLTDTTAVEVLLDWREREELPLYRLDTSTQSLTYDPTRRAAVLADKATGEVLYIGLAFATSA